MRDFCEYKYKYDLHVHTSPASQCGDFEPEEVILKYARIGFDGIVITNHFSRKAMGDFTVKDEYIAFYLNDYLLAKEAGEKHGLGVFLGFEMRFPENDNDYLVYGVDEEDAYRAFDYIDSDYEKFYREFKNENNVIIQAHPFRNSCSLQNLDIIDGIEVFNMHPGHNSRVAVAAKLTHDNPHLLVTGGTDFHHEGHQGMCATCTAEKITDSLGMAKLIKSGDFIFDIWGNKILFER